jgi:hypothetical protein
LAFGFRFWALGPRPGFWDHILAYLRSHPFLSYKTKNVFLSVEIDLRPPLRQGSLSWQAFGLGEPSGRWNNLRR